MENITIEEFSTFEKGLAAIINGRIEWVRIEPDPHKEAYDEFRWIFVYSSSELRMFYEESLKEARGHKVDYRKLYGGLSKARVDRIADIIKKVRYGDTKEYKDFPKYKLHDALEMYEYLLRNFSGIKRKELEEYRKIGILMSYFPYAELYEKMYLRPEFKEFEEDMKEEEKRDDEDLGRSVKLTVEMDEIPEGGKK